MGRKKKPETLKKEVEKYEKEVEILEQIIKEKNDEINLNENIKHKQEIIKEDLMKQLEYQEKFGKHFEDMIDDYIEFVEIKEKLQYDIKINGIRYKNTSGNGFTSFKPNESIKNLAMINTQMLKILQVLNLKEPDDDGGDDGDDLLSRN